jgi:hypothetical protein
MYDAVTPGNLPRNARLVAGYIDGLYRNMDEIDRAEPNAVHVTIAVDWRDRAMVLDRETGDASAEQAVAWCRTTMHDVPNTHLTVYNNTFDWPGTRAAFHAAGEPEPQWWVAHYDGDPAIPPGAVAKQYASNSAYDTSSVADHWPGVDPEVDVTPTELLMTRVPEAVLPNGYVPTVQDLLNGADKHAVQAVQEAQAAHASVMALTANVDKIMQKLGI